MELTMSRPTPGHPNTVSTNTEPASTPGSASAKRMSKVGSAFASTWRACTARAGTPFATAVRTHCSCNSSTTELRAYRAIPAPPMSVSVSTGSTAWRTSSANPVLPAGSRTPNAGSRSHMGTPNRAAPYVNSAMSVSASQKLGAAYTVVVASVSALSSVEPRFAPCTTPTNTPSTKVSTSEIPVSYTHLRAHETDSYL